MPVSVKRSTFKSKNPNIKHWLMVIPFILLLVGLAAAAFLLTTSQDLRQQAAGTTYIKCKSPADCPFGQLCRNGSCASPQCSNYLDCPIGQGCGEGQTCVVIPSGTSCMSNSQCANGSVCGAGHVCTTDQKSCQGSDYCDGNKIMKCVKGKWKAGNTCKSGCETVPPLICVGDCNYKARCK